MVCLNRNGLLRGTVDFSLVRRRKHVATANTSDA